MGDKMGRIHLGKQDLGELQTRKMKGLKRGIDVAVRDGMNGGAQDLDTISDGDSVDDDGDGVGLKKARLK